MHPISTVIANFPTASEEIIQEETLALTTSSATTPREEISLALLLPTELWSMTTSYLKLADRLNLSYTSTALRDVVAIPALWRQLYAVDFKRQLPKNEDNPKTQYQLAYQRAQQTALNLRQGKIQRVVTLPQDDVSEATISSDGQTIVTNSTRDGIIRLWDRTTNTCVDELSSRTEEVSTFAISPDGRWIATGTIIGAVSLWDRATKERRHLLPSSHARKAISTEFSHDSKSIIIRYDNSKIDCVYEVETGQPVALPAKYSTEDIESYIPFPNGKAIVATKTSAQLYDSVIRQYMYRLNLPTKRTGEIDDIRLAAFAPDGESFLIKYQGNHVLLADSSDGKWQHELHPTIKEILGFVNFSPDSRLIATIHLSNSIVLWDSQTGEQLQEVKLNSSWDHIRSFAFLPDNTGFVVVGDDYKAQLYDFQPAE